MSKRETFQNQLTIAFRELFEHDARYAMVKSRKTVEQLVEDIMELLPSKGVIIGDGVKLACKALHIKTTYKAINEYLSE